MKGWIANTDADWYRFLAARDELDEVNFWLPSDTRRFRAIEPGEPFFFKLKKPYFAVAGFGLFARFSVLPDWLAWESFGQANGTRDLATMRSRIRTYRDRIGRGGPADASAPMWIACLMVSNPTFFAESDWIPQPIDWAKSNLRGAVYDLERGEGRRVWRACLERVTQRPDVGVKGRIHAINASSDDLTLLRDHRIHDGPRFGPPRMVQQRLGQGIFRVAVTDAYQRACAVTTEHSLPVLEAAHIKPYSDGGEHDLRNGLLLRTDLHRLFDKGYVTVTVDARLEVSRRLRDDYENGRTYYAMQGTRVNLPPNTAEHPSPEYLEWHNNRRFLG
jgi:putative restriction endonuclease